MPRLLPPLFGTIASVLVIPAALAITPVAPPPGPASYNGDTQATTQIVTSPGDEHAVIGSPNPGSMGASATDGSGNYASASATASNQPESSLAASISVGTNGADPNGVAARADASETFGLEVVGPAGGLVPVVLQASGSFTDSGFSNSFFGAADIPGSNYVLALRQAVPATIPQGILSLVDYSVLAPNNSMVAGDQTLVNYRDMDSNSPVSTNSEIRTTGTLGSGYSGGFNDVVLMQLQVGTVYTVNLDAELFAGFTGGGTYSASASLDPMFTIDPNFGGAGLYQLELSPGIGDGQQGGAPAPEAVPTLALLSAALLALAGMPRRLQADSEHSVT